MDQVLTAYPKEVRFIHKEMPLTQIHPNPMPASKAAIAAGKQGKYWEMHHELFKIYRNLSTEEIRSAAGRVGLDMKKFEADWSSPEVEALVKEDMSVAAATGVTGTPTFFINGRRVMNRSFEAMKAMVDEELKKGK